MKILFDSCAGCNYCYICVIRGFKGCVKIEMVAYGLGVPSKPKEVEPYIKNVPFGVFMGLKHMLKRIEDRAAVREGIKLRIHKIAKDEYGY